MNLERPFAVITPTLDGAVLQALLTVEHLESGAEIHRRCATGSPHGVRKVLRRLVEQGVVEEINYVNAKFYRLERRHLAYDAIVALASLQDGLTTRIRDRLDGLPGLVDAGVTGLQPLTVRVVAQDGAVLAGAVWRYRMGELRKDLQIWTGSPAELDQRTLEPGEPSDETGN